MERFHLVQRVCVDKTVTMTPLPGYNREKILKLLRSGQAKCYDTMVIDEENNKPIAKVETIEESPWDIWNIKPKE